VRFRRDLHALVLTLVLGAVLAFGTHGAIAKQLPVATGKAPTAAQVDEAIAFVKADPNLANQRSMKTLKWASKPKESSGKWPAWLEWFFRMFGWIGALFGWIAQSGRVLVWVIAAVLAALLLIYITRVVRSRGLPQTAGKFVAPSHVRDLDIRPESLPDDIGGTARGFWDRGEHRAALALLYRGLLSRLVHVHSVPIRDSSTEGDCLALAQSRVSEEIYLYASSLVRIWLRAVYGGEQVDTNQVHALCEGFASTLDAKTTGIGGFGADTARQPA
jgi:hypothetical protein